MLLGDHAVPHIPAAVGTLQHALAGGDTYKGWQLTNVCAWRCESHGNACREPRCQARAPDQNCTPRSCSASSAGRRACSTRPLSAPTKRISRGALALTRWPERVHSHLGGAWAGGWVGSTVGGLQQVDRSCSTALHLPHAKAQLGLCPPRPTPPPPSIHTHLLPSRASRRRACPLSWTAAMGSAKPLKARGCHHLLPPAGAGGSAGVREGWRAAFSLLQAASQPRRARRGRESHAGLAAHLPGSRRMLMVWPGMKGAHGMKRQCSAAQPEGGSGRLRWSYPVSSLSRWVGS